MSQDKRLVIPANYPWSEVSTVISPNDEMLAGTDYAHYLAVGVSAMQNVHDTLKMHGLSSPSSILDMPCGHGRVTRALRAVFPAADISVCDLNEDGVDFCAKHFDARPFLSSSDFSTLDLGRKFDVIWVGSLITHLPKR